MKKNSTPPQGPLIWNRSENSFQHERVFGGLGVDLLYGNPLGQKVADRVLSRPWVSRCAGFFFGSRFSVRRIASFISEYEIPMEEYEEETFHSFNDFFIRRFRAGQREFNPDPSVLPAFAEGRYLAYPALQKGFEFSIKGESYTLDGLFANKADGVPFTGGPLLIARLCPVDYHRFHFPDEGRIFKQYRVAGKLHSVNPKAIEVFRDVFRLNERSIAILETKNFGKLAYVEVGALCVGKIIQTHQVDEPFERGEEKGYFLFGASTVLLLGEAGRWSPDEDVAQKTLAGIETYLRLGESVGKRV